MFIFLALIQTVCISPSRSIDLIINQTMSELEQKASQENKKIQFIDIKYTTTADNSGFLWDKALIIYDISRIN